MTELPEPQELFERFVLPHYDEEDRRRLIARVRGDLEKIYKPNLKASDICPFPSDYQDEVREQLKTMVDAAESDSAVYLKSRRPVSLEWLADFDRYWNSARILEMIQSSDPKESDNDYFILCIELGAALGRILTNLDSSLTWVCESPYWESFLYHPSTGHAIPVFSWAMKKFSGYAVDDGLVAKAGAAIEMLRRNI